MKEVLLIITAVSSISYIGYRVVIYIAKKRVKSIEELEAERLSKLEAELDEYIDSEAILPVVDTSNKTNSKLDKNKLMKIAAIGAFAAVAYLIYQKNKKR